MKKEGEELYLMPKNDQEKPENITYQETFDFNYEEKDTRSNFEKWVQILF